MITKRFSRWLLSLLAIAACLTVLSLPVSASACPNCADGLASSSSPGDVSDEDPLRESRAYNHSIYLMVAMPYFLLTAFGLVIFLAVVRHGRNARAAEAQKGTVSDPIPPANAG